MPGHEPKTGGPGPEGMRFYLKVCSVHVSARAYLLLARTNMLVYVCEHAYACRVCGLVVHANVALVPCFSERKISTGNWQGLQTAEALCIGASILVFCQTSVLPQLVSLSLQLSLCWVPLVHCYALVVFRLTLK